MKLPVVKSFVCLLLLFLFVFVCLFLLWGDVGVCFFGGGSLLLFFKC